jgi:hypothetical protein
MVKCQGVIFFILYVAVTLSVTIVCVACLLSTARCFLAGGVHVAIWQWYWV